MKIGLNAFISKVCSYLGREVGVEQSKVFLSFLEKNPAHKVLDCGCSDGGFTVQVVERIGTNRIYGIDVVEEFIERARAKGIEACQGDLNEVLPFEDESFDAVVACRVLEHLSNTDLFLKETHRILKVGGYVTILTNNLAAFHNIIFLLLGKQPHDACVSDEIWARTWHPKDERSSSEVTFHPLHRRIFTVGALEELLEYHGFQIEKSVGSGYYPLPNLLARLMCSIDKRHAAAMIVKARKS